jgi:hypothetical protein
MFTLPDGWSQDPLENAVFGLRLLRDGEGLVCRVLRIGLGPAINSGRRDRLHQLGRGLIRVIPNGLEHKPAIPGGMEVDVPHSPVTSTPFPPRSSTNET